MFGRKYIKAFKRLIRQFPLFYPKKTPSSLRWGIIGLGNMAEVFASALDEDKNSRIVGVASRSFEKAISFAKKHGNAKAYGSYDEMLKDTSLNLDVVYIATPAKYHVLHIKKCFESGKNVICEKPITINTKDLERLVDEAQQKNIFLMEGMWMKCLPTFQKAKEWLVQGKIGELELVKVDFYKREHINPQLTIFNPLEGGGVLHDFGVYAIAFISSFLGGIPDSIEKSVRMSSFHIDADWQINAEKDGVKAFISLSSDFKGESKAALIGSKGSIEWDAQFNRTNRIVRYDEYGVEQEVFGVDYISDGLEFEIAEVNYCIKSKMAMSPLVPLEESLNTLRIMDVLSSQ